MEVLEQPELATGEVDRAIAPHDPPRHEVHLQIGDFQPDSRNTSDGRPRRSSARIRASSSGSANGFTR